LQQRWSAFTASLILGAAWALWHSITFLQTTESLAWVVWQSATTVGLRVLIVWLYNNTGQSLFAAVAFHTMVNVSEFSYPVYGSHYDPFIATILIAITVAIVTFLWGPKTLARIRFT
jgi:membrane protease YdiL (CAAX protease family)